LTHSSTHATGTSSAPSYLAATLSYDDGTDNWDFSTASDVKETSNVATIWGLEETLTSSSTPRSADSYLTVSGSGFYESGIENYRIYISVSEDRRRRMRRRLAFLCDNSACTTTQDAAATMYNSTTSITFGPFDFSQCVGKITAQIEYQGLRPNVDVDVTYINYVGITDTSTTRPSSVVENNSVTMYGVGFFSQDTSHYVVNISACNDTYSLTTRPHRISSTQSMVFESVSFDSCKNAPESELSVTASVVSYEGYEYSEDCDPSLPTSVDIATLIRIVNREDFFVSGTTYDVSATQSQRISLEILGSVSQTTFENTFMFQCRDLDTDSYRSVWNSSNTSQTIFEPSNVELVNANTRIFTVNDLDLERCTGYIKTTSTETFESNMYVVTHFSYTRSLTHSHNSFTESINQSHTQSTRAGILPQSRSHTSSPLVHFQHH